MAECPEFNHLLVLPRLRVQNANAISSPLTHGFPAMSAFVGLMWALARKTRAMGLDVQFNAVGVVSHTYDEQVTEEGFVKSFRLTRNPLGKDEKTAAIVEEGRIHLELSLVFAVTINASLDDVQSAKLAAHIAELVNGMRIAGGSVVPAVKTTRRNQAYLAAFTGDSDGQQQVFNQLKMRLLPGFVLVERADVLTARHQQLQASNPQATRLEAWLSLARINYHWQESTSPDTPSKWQHDREGLGWLVPIPVGYGALTEVQTAGSVANARDNTTPFCFVESLFSTGQWISPHRLSKPQQLLWYVNNSPKQGHYRCSNDYSLSPVYEFID